MREFALWTGFLAPDSVEAARSEMETNYFGPLLLSRAFAPILAKNGGGAIVNVLSILSWVAVPSAGTYSASKAAAWALTNWLRNALQEQGTQVFEAGHDEVLADEMTRQVKAGLSGQPGIYLNFDPERSRVTAR
jgi:NAD(P)-dependent dehydrogenase (short-subunit alcohol dehydrogenase family)